MKWTNDKEKNSINKMATFIKHEYTSHKSIDDKCGNVHWVLVYVWKRNEKECNNEAFMIWRRLVFSFFVVAKLITGFEFRFGYQISHTF